MNTIPIPKKEVQLIHYGIKSMFKWILGLLVLAGILLTRLSSYLLYHSISEIFSIVVAFGIFILAWNTARFIRNSYLSIIGIGFFFVALIDSLHMLTFKGMGVLPLTSANIPTQLWLAGRYLEALILLAAPFFLKHQIKKNLIFIILSIVTMLLLGSIFLWQIFPTAYVDGSGLTLFKKTSEYVIVTIMLIAGFLLWINRSEFDEHILRSLIYFLVLSIAAEFMFTVYIGVTDWANLAGHLFKIVAFYFLYAALVDTGLSQPFDLIFHQLKKSEEKNLTTQVELKRLLEEGEVIHQELVKTFEDQKRAEAEKEELNRQLLHSQKMESVGRLAGGMAHDFNNQLSVILGHAETALSTVSPDQPEYHDLQQILAAADRSANLISKLLAFSRKQIVTPLVLDLNETISSMLRMLKRMIGEDIELVWLPGNNLKPVMMDPSQVDQVLVNLIVNARDAIKGVGKITIQTGSVMIEQNTGKDTGLPEGEYILLTIADNGCGMDDEILSHIFEPFFTTKEMGKGTGLGLATSYGIMKQNNGDIFVSSAPGVGTTFSIYLPASDMEITAIPSVNVEPVPNPGSGTILMVEDEVDLLQLCKDTLEDAGYSVIWANTPGEALRLVQEYIGSIDLVITDVIMPNMNGKELVSQIHMLRPGLKSLFISGYTADIIADHGMLEPDVFFLQKPFSLGALKEKVRLALGSKIIN